MRLRKTSKTTRRMAAHVPVLQQRELLLITRSTFVVDGPLALRSQRLAAAREGAIGRDILTFPLLAARLAGGFLSPVGTDVLFPAIQGALADGGFQDVASVAGLPGMPRAVLQSLDAIWRADIDLSSLPNDISRLRRSRIG